MANLKNKAIEAANPGVTANSAFIDALYLEKEGRKATQAEKDKFTVMTVKDAANIILGAKLSPFMGVKTIPAPVKQAPTPALVK